MHKKYFHLVTFLGVLLMFQHKSIADTNTQTMLLTHKTPTCGCCKEWVKHAKDNGFKVKTQDHQNLEEIKNIYDIKPEYRSCHTSVSTNGFIFEGHIPAKYIAKFLSEDYPNAIGLSVPGMPWGSPGMEAQDRFTPYKIMIIFKDGSSRVYASVNN